MPTSYARPHEKKRFVCTSVKLAGEVKAWGWGQQSFPESPGQSLSNTQVYAVNGEGRGIRSDGDYGICGQNFLLIFFFYLFGCGRS